jgi:hypothetical protein
MTKKEFYAKIGIIATILLLFLADVGMGIFIITKRFR